MTLVSEYPSLRYAIVLFAVEYLRQNLSLEAAAMLLEVEDDQVQDDDVTELETAVSAVLDALLNALPPDAAAVLRPLYLPTPKVTANAGLGESSDLEPGGG